MTFSMRSYQKELLDEDEIPFAHIKQNMKELDFINTWLGGHKITLDAFKYLSKGKRIFLYVKLVAAVVIILQLLQIGAIRKILGLTFQELILKKNVLITLKAGISFLLQTG